MFSSDIQRKNLGDSHTSFPVFESLGFTLITFTALLLNFGGLGIHPLKQTNKNLKAEIFMWWWDFGELTSGKIPSIAGDTQNHQSWQPCCAASPSSTSAAFPACVGRLLHRIDFYGVIYSEQGFCLLWACNAPHMHHHRNNLVQSAWDFKHRAVHSQKSIWPKNLRFCAPSAGSGRAGNIHQLECCPFRSSLFPNSHPAAPLLGTGGHLWEGLGAFQYLLVSLHHGTWTGYECENGGDCAASSCAAARRPWVCTWKGWLMPGLRCFQLPPLPHPSILIFRCSPPPPYCASEASS